MVNVWIGNLKLKFSWYKEKSILTECKHSGPFIVQRSFYSQEDKITPHVYLLHPAGGLVGGDQLILNVELESGSRALLTTVGSSNFYRTNGSYALQRNIFKLAKNTILEWMPKSNIFFPKSKATIDTTFILEDGARVIACEILCFNNLVLNSSIGPEELNFLLNINLSNSVGLRERLQLNESDYTIKLGGFKISALFFVVPSNEKMLCQVRMLMEKELVNDDLQIGGATLLGELLIVRLLGNDNQKLNRLLYCLWRVVRPIVVGKDVVIPRIWNT